ncbi:hypothetical protein MPSEU_000511400 [Mayamaea pseudoterrestris]|nr:hypothetical protein MPSEU_000511400 [Mayamaea pseudoterrestris]
MKSTATTALLLALSLASTLGFIVQPLQRRSTTAIRMNVPPAVSLDYSSAVNYQQQSIAAINPMEQGIDQFLAKSSSSSSAAATFSSSSSQLVSLKERYVPTPEEVAAKKRNFNILFWGGGFVAPFVATVFYFGFRFWEK